MSGGHSNIRWLQVGEQSGTTDTPGAFKFLTIQNEFFPDSNQSKEKVETQRNDGNMAAPVVTTKSGGLSAELLVRGKGAGAGDGVASVEHEFAELFKAALGAAGGINTGDTLDADVHSASVLLISSTGNFVVGDHIIVNVLGSGGTQFEAREVTAVSTDTSITVSPALSAVPPAEALVAYQSTSYREQPAVTNHTHLYFKAEGENWRRDYLGCSVTWRLEIKPGQLGKLIFDVRANDWEDVAEEDPSYSAETDSTALSIQNVEFFIDDANTELIEGTLTGGFTIQPRVASNGANGQNGWIYTYEGAKFSGKIYHSDTTEATLKSASTVALFCQIGDPADSGTPGNCFSFRIPAFSADPDSVKGVAFNGIDALDFSGIATRASGVSTPLRMGLFASAS